jgi:hypothetical protein
MININKCTIELNVNSTHYLVSDNNKMKCFTEHKGETSEGKPIHYSQNDRATHAPNENKSILL